TGVLVIAIGLWTLWTQRELILQLQGVPALPRTQERAEMRFRPSTQDHSHGHHQHPHAHGGVHDHAHDHSHGEDHDHGEPHSHAEEGGYHSHGWGFKHTHDLKLATINRPSLWVLIGLGIAGGLLPDPAALAILLNALAQGKVMLGLGTVVVFSVGFAATLVVVGVVAAKVGQRILDWLAGAWAARIQIGTSLVIVVVGAVLSFKAWSTLNALP
ncbi:MAG TPA: hypothetical protein VF523_08965, partial [Burkholderiales bacterium]